jgi:hypothetical protein
MNTNTTNKPSPRRKSLCPKRIFDTALGLADEIGVEALAIRKLATASL